MRPGFVGRALSRAGAPAARLHSRDTLGSIAAAARRRASLCRIGLQLKAIQQFHKADFKVSCYMCQDVMQCTYRDACIVSNGDSIVARFVCFKAHMAPALPGDAEAQARKRFA